MNLPGMADRPRMMGMTFGRRFQEWVKNTRPNVLGNWRRWILISAIAMTVALSGLVISGVNLGLEFAGGRLFEISTTTEVDIDELRETLADGGLPRASIQESGSGNLIIRTEELSEAEEEFVLDAVAEAGGETNVVRDQFVGPTLGDELRNKALIALGIALLVQLIYLAFRFRWTFALSSVLAMVHDVAILIGLFAWLGKTFDGVFLASLLTVIGYSVNDSVVIFDRIREQMKLRPDDPVELVANDACLQTVPRTINTGLGAMLILISLYVLGGDTLADFALALLIGIIIGTYSSVFTASPLAIFFEERYPRPPPEPEPKTPVGRSRNARR
jgi:SecD/SecF fusion protein